MYEFEIIGMIIKPGIMKCMYGRPLISPMRSPIKFPNIVIYKNIVITEGRMV
jgi:hypothetical protein